MLGKKCEDWKWLETTQKTQKSKESFSSGLTDTNQAQIWSEAEGKPPVGGLQYNTLWKSEAFHLNVLLLLAIAE